MKHAGHIIIFLLIFGNKSRTREKRYQFENFLTIRTNFSAFYLISQSSHRYLFSGGRKLLIADFNFLYLKRITLR